MRLVVLTMLLLAVVSCSPADEADPTTSEPAPSTTTTTSAAATTVPPDFTVTSPDFADGEPIPARFTCDGEDLSPQIDVVGIPAETQSLTLIVDDPDAPLGTWTHWLEFDISAGPGSHDFPEGVENPGVAGVNSWNLPGYMGPCPPEGEAHTYFFRVYAVDITLGLPAGVNVEAVLEALDGNVIATTELTGSYSR